MASAGKRRRGRRKLQKRIFTALALFVVLAAAGIVYAAYTSQDYMRGVVRNRDNEQIRFTSNLLQSCAAGTEASSYPGRVVLYSTSGENAQQKITMDLYVYNYVAGNQSLVSEKDIAYTMTITLTGGTGADDSYTVEMVNGTMTKAGSGLSYSAKSTLIGRTPNADHYQVTFPAADIDKIRITATAIPDNTSLTGNQILAAVIAPSTKENAKIFSCTGTFIDQASGLPGDYDGINYEVSVAGGKGNVSLQWDPAVVEIDPFFLTKLKNAGIVYTLTPGTGNGDLSTLAFVMDQTNGTGDYLIPFYFVDKENKIFTTGTDGQKQSISWETMGTYIKVDGSQIVSEN